MFTIDTLAVEAGKPDEQIIEGRSAVGVVGSGAFDAAAQSERYLLISEIMLCPDALSALGEVAAGTADIAVLDEVNARALTAVSGSEYTIHSQPLYSASVAVILPAQSELERCASRAVRWIARRGRLEKLSLSTLGADITA